MCPKLIELSRGMARPFMFAALCQHVYPRKHSLAESKKQREKSLLAKKFVSRVTRQPRYHCITITVSSERNLSTKLHTNSQTQHIFLTVATSLGFNRQAIIMGTTEFKGTFRLSETKAEAVRGLWGGGNQTHHFRQILLG